MSLSDHQRNQTLLLAESQIIEIASKAGRSEAAEFARLHIDGSMNGLLRIDEVEEVAKFSFALSDRIVGGLRGETAMPRVEPPPEEEKEPTGNIVTITWDPWGHLKSYALGFGHGLMFVGLISALWGMIR